MQLCGRFPTNSCWESEVDITLFLGAQVEEQEEVEV